MRVGQTQSTVQNNLIKMNNMSYQLLPWQQAYADLLNNIAILDSQLQAINQENIQLQQILDNQIIVQGQLLATISNQPQSDDLQQPQCTDEGRRPDKKHKISGTASITPKKRSVKSQIYHCPYEDCSRIYKSAISMNLHIKINHNGGTKKQREAYAKQLLDAEKGLCAYPQARLNLPPNFMEQFKKNYEYCKKYNM